MKNFTAASISDTAQNSLTECIESIGTPISTTFTPRSADSIGPIVEPQRVSLCPANIVYGTSALLHNEMNSLQPATDVE